VGRRPHSAACGSKVTTEDVPRRSKTNKGRRGFNLLAGAMKRMNRSHFYNFSNPANRLVEIKARQSVGAVDIRVSYPKGVDSFIVATTLHIVTVRFCRYHQVTPSVKGLKCKSRRRA